MRAFRRAGDPALLFVLRDGLEASAVDLLCRLTAVPAWQHVLYSFMCTPRAHDTLSRPLRVVAEASLARDRLLDYILSWGLQGVGKGLASCACVKGAEGLRQQPQLDLAPPSRSALQAARIRAPKPVPWTECAFRNYSTYWSQEHSRARLRPHLYCSAQAAAPSVPASSPAECQGGAAATKRQP